ncbi:hypothetical protein SESBI_46369 [Sesbania bispinosa]|nr:hypothetical protein SESBI_46369 [Sesbania bispinosa]
MEKLSQMRNKLFKFLLKQPVASMPVQNPTLSPSTGVTVSIIPKEARRKHRSGSFSAREPSSPKVSCMGQVQCKKKRMAQKQNRVQRTPTKKRTDSVSCHDQKKFLAWIFKGSAEGPKQREKASVLEENSPPTEIAPSLGSMKKFAGGRGTLSNFDVTLVER